MVGVKGHRSKEHRLERAEIKRILSSAKDNREKYLFCLLCYTGMRIGEAVHCEREWVDWSKGQITVPYTTRCDRHKKCRERGNVWRAKTKDAERVIPIVPELKITLKKIFNEYKKISDFIPSESLGWWLIKNLGRRAGIKLFPHAIRATFATMLAEMEFSPFEIKDTMGWRTIMPAQDYVKLSGSRIREVFKKWKTH